MTGTGGCRAGAAALIAVLAAAQPALAEEKPFVEGRLVFRIDGEEIYRSDDPDEETRDIFPRIDSDLVFHLGGGVELFNGLQFKEYEDLEPGEKRYAEDLGATVEELGLRYRGEGWMVQAGKLHPVFGLAHDDAPGLFGDDFAKDYEIEEVWAAGFAVDLPWTSDLLGQPTLSGSLFMTDRTVLAGSAFADREVDQLEDGGPANTRWPRSLVVALEGGDGRYTPGSKWHLGFIHRAAGEGDEGTELGVALAASHKSDLGHDMGLYLIAEGAYFHDYEGSRDNATYVTVGAEISWLGFFASGAASAIMIDADADEDDRVDHLLTFDLGHEWRIGDARFSISAAWVGVEEKEVGSEGYGFRLRYRLPI